MQHVIVSPAFRGKLRTISIIVLVIHSRSLSVKMADGVSVRMGSIDRPAYVQKCLFASISGSLISAGLISLVDFGMFQQKPTAQTFGRYFGGLYLYHALQCPMEALQRRSSFD